MSTSAPDGALRGRRLLIVATGTRETASSRHRLWNYRDLLVADGVRIEWVEYGDPGGALAALGRRASVLWEADRGALGADVVLVQKLLLPAALLSRWTDRGIRVVYDFDDALFTESIQGESAGAVRRRKGRLDAVLAAADRIVAGSGPLAEYVEGRGRTATVLHPSLDRSSFPVEPRRPQDGVLRVGWLGNAASQRYLREHWGVLAEVFAAEPRARLVVCSSEPPSGAPAELEGRIDFVPWSESAQMESTERFDVAFSPMGTDPWSLARGGRVSVLVSMAMGVPVVASPGGGLEALAGSDGGIVFGPDRQALRDGLTGLLADADRRREVGARARHTIDRRVWADVQYPQLRTVLFG